MAEILTDSTRKPRGGQEDPTGAGSRASGRVGSIAVHPTVDPLPTDPSLPKTRKPYETPTPDRLADLERATVADAELIHTCRWKAQAARQRIANRRAEIERLRLVAEEAA